MIQETVFRVHKRSRKAVNNLADKYRVRQNNTISFHLIQFQYSIYIVREVQCYMS